VHLEPAHDPADGVETPPSVRITLTRNRYTPGVVTVTIPVFGSTDGRSSKRCGGSLCCARNLTSTVNFSELTVVLKTEFMV
jgi:hypothetical protein